VRNVDNFVILENNSVLIICQNSIYSMVAKTLFSLFQGQWFKAQLSPVAPGERKG